MMGDVSYLDLQFPWYQNGIKTIRPSGLITLRQFISAVISPKPEMVEAFELIKQASLAGNKEEKDRLKTEKLFFTTPSVMVDPIRNYDSIKSFLPFAVLEYDDIPHAEVLRDYIFEKQKSCIFAFSSPSKSGCKFIFYIDTPTSVKTYKELYFGIAQELDKFKSLDISNERCVLPLFNSYDPDAKFREDAVPSSKRGFKENAFVPFVGEIFIPDEVSEDDRIECFNLISFLVDRIDDSAHNQVVSCSFLAGGLCPYYGICQNEMWSVLEERVRDNQYMKKGTEGYLTTARTMFNKGLYNPTALKKDEK